MFESLLEVTSLHSFDPVAWRIGPANATSEFYGSGKITGIRPAAAAAGAGMVVASLRGIGRLVPELKSVEGYHFILRHRDGHLGRELGRGTSSFGKIFFILTVLSWICAGIRRRGGAAFSYLR